MKVIFLDFDGVINDIHNQDRLINPLFVSELKKVIDETGAKVVVTSNRRDSFLVNGQSFKSACYQQFIKPLEEMGINIYDYTPFINARVDEERELEIEEYLHMHPLIEEYVIIEDDYVMKRNYEHQVFIEYSDGFTSKYVLPTIKILNGVLGFYPYDYNLNETFQERIKRLFPSLSFEEIEDILNSNLLEEDQDKKL